MIDLRTRAARLRKRCLSTMIFASTSMTVCNHFDESAQLVFYFVYPWYVFNLYAMNKDIGQQ